MELREILKKAKETSVGEEHYLLPLIRHYIERGKIEEAFKELRKLPKSEVERIWKIVVKGPVIPHEKEMMIYEIIEHLRKQKPEAEKSAQMTYEEALLEARKWAEGMRDRSVSAAVAYEYILALPVAVEEARMMGLPPEEGELTQLRYILVNLGAWRGPTAREAKKAIKARIEELERKLRRRS